MAISSQTSSITYTGNASTSTPYAVPFRYDDSAWVVVEEIDEDGVITVLALGSDYTLTGSGLTVSGNVVTGGGAIPATSTLRISRDTERTQTFGLTPNGKIPAANIGKAFDKLTMAAQDGRRKLESYFARTIRSADGETLSELPVSADRADLYLGFDGDGSVRLVSATTILGESDGAPLGVGIPAGGTVGQEFRKTSGADYAAGWKNKATLHVADYGLPLNGTSLCNTAFQDCFTDALALGIKTIEIPAGNFVLNTLVVPAGFHLRGAAPSGATAWTGSLPTANLTRLITQNATSDVLKCELIQSTTIENVEIEHVSGSVTSTGYGIRIENATPGDWPGAPFRLINSTIRNFARGLYNDSGNRIHIDGSHLVQCDYGYYSTGVTSTLSCINSELGGIPKDGGNGQAWYLSNAQGAIFAGCEFGNCYRVGTVENSSVVKMTGCNFESVSGPYGIGISTGRLDIDASSCAAVTGVMVRNTGAQANLVSFNGFTIRSGGSVLWDGQAVGYETSVDNDFPTLINTGMACRRMTSDFTTTETYWSNRNPLPFEALPWKSRIELSAAPTAGSGFNSMNGGGVSVNAGGVQWGHSTTAGSLIACNLSKSINGIPLLRNPGSSEWRTFDWSKRFVARFDLGLLMNFGALSSDSDCVIAIGAPYLRGTPGTFTAAASDICTKVAHGFRTGEAVRCTTSAADLPAPLVEFITYYVIRLDADTFSLATSSANALLGTAINITDAGTGTHSIVFVGRLNAKGTALHIAGGTVSAVVHDGTTELAVALGSIADAANKQVVFDYDGAGTLKASMAGHYDVLRTGGPTGVSDYYGNSVFLQSLNTAGGTAPLYSLMNFELAHF